MLSRLGGHITRSPAAQWGSRSVRASTRVSRVDQLVCIRSQRVACTFSTSLPTTNGVDTISRDVPHARRAFSAETVSVCAQTQGQVEDWRMNLRNESSLELFGQRGEEWWTGPVPTSPTHSLPYFDIKSLTRADLLDYFKNTWVLTESLFAGLQGEEPFFRPPYHELRHPLIFYYGHPACLYINKLRVAGILSEPVNAYFEEILETGVDEMRWDDLSKNHMEWPTVDEIHTYRKQVFDKVCEVIESYPGFETLATDMQASPWWSVLMSVEHERIHLETSSVLFRELPLSVVHRPTHWPAVHPSANDRSTSPTQAQAPRPSFQCPVEGENYPRNPFIPVEAGVASLGKPKDFPTYGWDNEYGRKDMQIPAFKASKYMVTNGEFYQFVQSGGYCEQKYWSEDGWAWRCFRNSNNPCFWVQQGPKGLHQYKLRTVFEEVDMQWDWPAVVNYHEAKAFCAWKTERDRPDQPYRVLTEAEHHRLRDGPQADHSVIRQQGAKATHDRSDSDSLLSIAAESDNDKLTWLAHDPVMRLAHPSLGDRSEPQRSEARALNMNLVHGSEGPVTNSEPTRRGFHDVMGNVWEWCEDHQSPLPGFETHPVYVDFTLPCFDGEHQMIMGGSFVSTGDEASHWARYQFRPHFFQHASFRVVEPVLENDHEPWLATSCMDNEGPYAGKTSPFRSSEEGTRASGAAADVLRTDSQSQGSVDAQAVGAVPGLGASPGKLSSTPAQKQTQADYEHDEWLSRYLHLHFPPQQPAAGSYPTWIPSEARDFPVRCADKLLDAARAVNAPMGTALDLGCGVGGATFQLATARGGYESVTGVELSSAFVRAANMLATEGHVDYELRVEGDMMEVLRAQVPEHALRDRVRFLEGDAAEPSEDWGGPFDAILLGNLVCRLAQPSKTLAGIAGLLNPGGLLLITSPFSWKPEFSSREEWLGGTENGPRGRVGLAGVMEANGMELLEQGDMPLTIRHHARFYELIGSHATLWQRK